MTNQLCGELTWHIVRGRGDSGGEKAARCNLFFLTESADLFSGFTQITSSCSQIFTERHGLRNAASLLPHAQKARHFSPGKRSHFSPFKDPEKMRKDAP